jgi:hypothetical protein
MKYKPSYGDKQRDEQRRIKSKRAVEREGHVAPAKEKPAGEPIVQSNSPNPSEER